MNVELDRQDILNILAALNSIEVKGKASMLTVLQLINKLEVALKEEPKSDG